MDWHLQFSFNAENDNTAHTHQETMKRFVFHIIMLSGESRAELQEVPKMT